jgi:hypothetical protein
MIFRPNVPQAPRDCLLPKAVSTGNQRADEIFGRDRHRQGFKCYWRWNSRVGRVGRPRIDLEIRDLIRRISHENPTWGVPRIQAELHLLGYKVAESTVAKYRVRIRKSAFTNMEELSA